MYSYATKYYNLLENNNLSPLNQLSPCKRRHILQALSNLSKYQGRYDDFKKLMHNSDIKWNTTSATDIFKKIYTNTQSNNNGTLEWVLECKKVLKWQHYFPIAVMLLTGLRTSEALSVLNLVFKGEFGNYYNAEFKTLEHFRYPDIFIRTTKNTYISLLPPSAVNAIAKWNYKPLTYSGLRCTLRRKKLTANFYDTRSWYATYLRQHGIESEFIDLLQGRIPASIFSRHYYKPNIQSLSNRVSDLLEPLAKQLLC
jgi:intergrase/recombinase